MTSFYLPTHSSPPEGSGGYLSIVQFILFLLSQARKVWAAWQTFFSEHITYGKDFFSSKLLRFAVLSLTIHSSSLLSSQAQSCTSASPSVLATWNFDDPGDCSSSLGIFGINNPWLSGTVFYCPNVSAGCGLAGLGSRGHSNTGSFAGGICLYNFYSYGGENINPTRPFSFYDPNATKFDPTWPANLNAVYRYPAGKSGCLSSFSLNILQKQFNGTVNFEKQGIAVKRNGVIIYTAEQPILASQVNGAAMVFTFPNTSEFCVDGSAQVQFEIVFGLVHRLVTGGYDTPAQVGYDNISISGTCTEGRTPTASATAATCGPGGVLANGSIALSGYVAGAKYDYVAGSSYTGTATFSTATAIPAGGVITNTLANPTSPQVYTIRIFASATCYKDVQVTLTPTFCPIPCPQPTGIVLTPTLATCNGTTSNNNGQIAVTGVTNGDKVGISTGTTYSGPGYTGAGIQTLSRGGFTFTGLANPVGSQAYTIRVYNGTNNCYIDKTIELLEEPCGPCANACVQVVSAGNPNIEINVNNNKACYASCKSTGYIDLELTKTVNVSSGLACPTPTNFVWTITLQNKGTITATDIDVADLLPAGLLLVSASPSVGRFGGALWSINSLQANESATLTLTTQALKTGSYTNYAYVHAASPDNDIDSSPNNDYTANEDDDDNATITVTGANPPIVAKEFSPMLTKPNTPTRLTIKITNYESTPITITQSFIDNLPNSPAQMTIAPTPNLVVSNGIAVSATAGGNQVIIPAGTVLPPGLTQIQLDVIVPAEGSYCNDIAAGALQTSSCANIRATSACILANSTFVLAPLIRKAFSPQIVAVNQNSTLTITVENRNTHTLTLTSNFYDYLPSGLVVAGAATSSCGTVTASVGGSIIGLTTGSVIPPGTCTIVVPVKSTTAGTYCNLIQMNAIITEGGGRTNVGNEDVAEACLEVKNSACTTVSTVSITPVNPTVAPNGTISLAATATGTNVNSLYFWSVSPVGGVFSTQTASTTYTAPATAGTYTIKVLIDNRLTGYGTCKDSTTTTVTVALACTPPSPTGTPAARCGTGTVTLTATGCDATYPAVWFSDAALATQVGTGNSFTTPAITATTTYYVACVKDATCKSAGVSVVATVNALPTASAVATAATCNAAGTAANADGGLTLAGFGATDKYDYNLGATYTGSATYASATAIPAGGVLVSNLANPAAATTYTIRVFNAAGCFVDLQAVLQPTTCTPTCTPPTPIGVAAARCGTGTVTLTATGCDATYPAVWFSDAALATQVGTGNSFTTPSLTTTTTYYVACVKDATCKSVGVSVVATVNSAPTLSLGAITCAANGLTYSVAFTSNGTVTASLGTISGNSVTAIPAGQTVTLTATLNGCTSSTTAIQSCTVPVFDLALVKKLGAGQSSTVTPGSSVTFTITVYNQGNVDATNVQLSDYIPAGLTLNDANWTANAGKASLNTPIASLTAGASTTRNIVFTVGAGVTGVLTNTAEISSATGGTDKDSTPDSDPTNDGTAQNDVTTGDHKTNPNDDEDDADPEPITVTPACTPPTPIGVAAARCGTGTVTLTATGCDATYPAIWFSNAALTAQVGTGNSFTTPSLTTTTTYYVACVKDAACKSAGVSVVATVNPAPTLTVSNVVCAANLLTYSLSFASTGTVTSTAGTLSGNTVTGITAGTSITLTATLNGCTTVLPVTAPNCACPTVNPPTGNSASICAGTTIPALSVTLGAGLQANWYSAATGGTLLQANSLSYTPTAAGTFYVEALDAATGCKSATRTAVVLTIKPNPSLTPGSPVCSANGQTYSVNVTTNGTLTSTAGTVNGSTISNIPVGTNITLTASLNGCTATATVTSPNCTVPVFDLALVKKLATGQAGTVTPGSSVTFTITVYNQGNVDATNVQLSDYIPAGLTLNDANWTANAGKATLNTPIASLAAGASTTRNIVFTVGAGVTGVLTNTAEISSATGGTDKDSTPDNDPTNDGTAQNDVTTGNHKTNPNDDEDDSDPEPITVLPTPVFDLALVKKLATGQAGTVTPGSSVTFTITVYNQGNVDATNVQLSDYIPAGLTLNDANWTANAGKATLNTPIASLAAGASTTRNIVFTVGAGVTGVLTNTTEISSATGGTDKDSTPDNDPTNDGTAQNDVTTGDHKTNPNDDEDDSDPEPITVTPSCAISLTTNSLPVGTVGQAYSANLTVSGGTAPYSFLLVGGTLPTGLTLSSTGLISGIPTATGTFSTTIRISDSQSCSVTVPLAVLNIELAPVCSLRVTTTPGSCQSATNTYSVSGTLSLTNNTNGGTIQLSDGTQLISLSVASGVSSVPYSLTGLVSDGLVHTLTATLSGCGTASVSYTAPQSCTAACPAPIHVCKGTSYGFEISATSGLGTYQWYRNGSAISGATGSSFTATQAGSYSVVVNGNVVGQCPDGSCCPVVIVEDEVPLYQANVQTPTCRSNVPNADGRILVSGWKLSNNDATTYTYSISLGSSFNASQIVAGGANQVVPASGVLVTTLPNPSSSAGQSYTIRIQTGEGCYRDVVVNLPQTQCACPPAKCVPFVITKKVK
ncbi:DUF11 domain-containing protein [Spirosoma sp. KCTC 42546]|uniref:Ig-like domain-containing protein n=1 Tax=Spirosoma sp. KCTC 42546 TaxID=2520506 RepID=UPI00115A08D6|nr:putative Ig domain-containing protein [Spirosoma sp. KCTC 42546]QDK82146.1 DUF11 domain-containing protein [Spirosoma sp. KCTC 42546]